ncbi:IS66 family transposase [Nitrococcus mobilis]|uniref:Hypothetical Y4jO n=1 Tax=Nitrococcus mobilis Nb-231 TaxID=314278 RepID=A4BNS6_9GAMM|nr:transposase [Nitrococcus mobilis]EAR21248.1 hypothetical Y4jO [Nitrococcus mobilis Nb-231]EAR22875.1 hypothetical Y4jO [Nitrococcus mobilis Nb-231]
MRDQGLPQAPLARLAALEPSAIEDYAAWQATLKRLGISNERHVRIVTEGALLGTVIATGINPERVIVSDDAGQFNVLTHALCWIHVERGIQKLLGFNADQRAALAWARSEPWTIYQALKAYKAESNAAARGAIEARFEALCTTKTCFESLNRALERLHNSGAELLRALDSPELALHNNLAERDIREYVKRRKISGSTRSAAGRRCRDTLASLKKTCRKHGLSFWAYLLDRLAGASTIPWLPSAIFGAHSEPAAINYAHPSAGP